MTNNTSLESSMLYSENLQKNAKQKFCLQNPVTKLKCLQKIDV